MKLKKIKQKEVLYISAALFLIILVLPLISKYSLLGFAVVDEIIKPLTLSELENEVLMLVHTQKFSRDTAELTINKKIIRPLVEARMVLSDSSMNKDAKTEEEVAVTVVTPLEKKSVKLKELGPSEALFFRKLLFVTEYTQSKDPEVEQVLTEGEKPVLFFYSNSKGFFRYVANKEDVVEEEKKEETKTEDTKESAREEKGVCVKRYKAEEVEGDIGYERIKDATSCDGFEAKHKDRLYDLAKQKAMEECTKIKCESALCNCQKSFTFTPYRSSDFSCTATTVGGIIDVVVTYENTGACVCSCE